MWGNGFCQNKGFVCCLDMGICPVLDQKKVAPSWSVKGGITCNPFLVRDVAGKKDFHPCTCLKY